MPVLNSFKATDGYISELTRATDQAGWTAFQSPGIEFHGACSISVDGNGILAVDFAQQRTDFQAPNLMGQSQPDPGTPPEPNVVLVDSDSVNTWMDGSSDATKNGYCAALWIHEQLAGSSRQEIKTALGI